MAITMTQAAADHVNNYLTNRGHGEGVRLGVRTTGCSGMAYILEFVDQIAAEDEVFDTLGVKIVIDPKSLLYLDGTELDYAKEGLNEGFQFNNPNAKGECGCGESFNV
ncbi:MAG: iron-sulfur cluster assembly protein IscA [Oceanospirillaceae bacterium]|jgi:iron-sulfur cluster assembly protein|nr:iron-sulfur cluster assembly protein IscA [Oceanospirillaceae bacterium]MBT4442417.1 iron-sulfur cluster assembly protein IscA [Oceanospirillaceae bacterium]MBT6078392.1 iron-sulfur cluster assembly protein IscA [Oceanospirillaceae bacterium]